MRGLTALPMASILTEEEVHESWVYLATGMSTDKSDGNNMWEMWNVAGGAGAYCVGTGDWYMLNGDKWEHLGDYNADFAEIHNKACDIKAYSYWRLEDGVWNAIQGRLERDELIEKTKQMVAH